MSSSDKPSYKYITAKDLEDLDYINEGDPYKIDSSEYGYVMDRIFVPTDRTIYLGDHNNNGISVTDDAIKRLYFTSTSVFTRFVTDTDGDGILRLRGSSESGVYNYVGCCEYGKFTATKSFSEAVTFAVMRIHDHTILRPLQGGKMGASVENGLIMLGRYSRRVSEAVVCVFLGSLEGKLLMNKR